MQASDRRAAPRFRISIPLHFQSPQSAEPECAAETLDISSRGVLMETDAPPRVGTILLMRIRLPEMVMGSRVPEWSITAHVVHIESGSEPGKFGVGVQFHYYEPATPRHDPIIARSEPADVRRDGRI